MPTDNAALSMSPGTDQSYVFQQLAVAVNMLHSQLEQVSFTCLSKYVSLKIFGYQLKLSLQKHEASLHFFKCGML